MPAEWLQQLDVDALHSVLGNCKLCHEARQLSITHLWPGGGGASLRVAPQVGPYTVEVLGAWPDAWNILSWVHAVDGLDPQGTVFAGEEEGGSRTRPDEQLVPGASYYLIAHRDFPTSPAKRAIQHYPTSIEVRRLIPSNGWEAWKFTLPQMIDRFTHRWCQSLGYPLEEAPWSLRVVSPPPQRYELNKTPIFTVGDEVILAASPPSDQSSFQLPPELIVYCDGFRCFSGSTPLPSKSLYYFAIPLSKAGRYQVSDAVNRSKVSPCFLLAEEPGGDEPDASPVPAPLRVRLKSSSDDFLLDAFADGVGPHKRAVLCSEDSAVPLLDVICPIPVTVSWSGVGGRRAPEETEASKIAESVTPDLLKSLVSGQTFTLHLDAGSFGLLRLELVSAGFQQVAETTFSKSFAESSLPRELLSQARWLAIAISAMERQKGVLMTPLPRQVRAILGTLAAREDCSFLSRLSRVPTSLMPHLLALARSLEKSGHLIEISKR